MERKVVKSFDDFLNGERIQESDDAFNFARTVKFALAILGEIFHAANKEKDSDLFLGKIANLFDVRTYGKSAYSLNKNVNVLLYSSFGYGLSPTASELSNAILKDVRAYNEDIKSYSRKLVANLQQIVKDEL